MDGEKKETVGLKDWRHVYILVRERPPCSCSGTDSGFVSGVVLCW